MYMGGTIGIHVGWFHMHGLYPIHGRYHRYWFHMGCTLYMGGTIGTGSTWAVPRPLNLDSTHKKKNLVHNKIYSSRHAGNPFKIALAVGITSSIPIRVWKIGLQYN